jgi:hypothetical protein
VEIPQAYRISALGDCVVAEPEAWHRIWIQTAQPTEINPGSIEEGEYAVIDGELHVKARGCLISKLRLHPGDDAALIARRLLREYKPGRDFYKPIEYPNWELCDGKRKSPAWRAGL